LSAIAEAILKEFPRLNDTQREAIAQTEGPLLVIAGPGSGKTLVLVLRTLNVLLKGLADPEEIILCTFTEKAAFELRDRLSLLARKLKYDGNLTSLHVGTIMGWQTPFCFITDIIPRLGTTTRYLMILPNCFSSLIILMTLSGRWKMEDTLADGAPAGRQSRERVTISTKLPKSS